MPMVQCFRLLPSFPWPVSTGWGVALSNGHMEVSGLSSVGSHS